VERCELSDRLLNGTNLVRQKLRLESQAFAYTRRDSQAHEAVLLRCSWGVAVLN
jgi:hypothetical protein